MTFMMKFVKIVAISIECLALEESGDEMIYLDYSATTPVHPEVLTTFTKVNNELFANPDSLHNFGGKVATLLQKAKEVTAQLLKVQPQELIFTSGATEANNLALRGIAFANRQRGNHIITSVIEHPSVYDTLKQLEQHFGFEVTYLPVDHTGKVSVVDVQAAIRPTTILVSIMAINNEVGSIQPIAEIGKILSEYPKIYFHVDAVQAVGKVTVDIKEWRIDLLTCSAHKMFGLKGSGLLFKRIGVNLMPLQTGGSQEDGYRAGTPNVAANVAFAKTLRLALEHLPQKQAMVQELNTYVRTLLEQKVVGVVCNSSVTCSPYILNISIPPLRPEVIVHGLDAKGIYLSTRSACSSKEAKASRVLTAMHLRDEVASSGIRVSLSHETTKEQLNIFVDELANVVEQMRKVVK
ncbi:MAG: cysteine desulfurase family protein [Culicoidibacterales bacterium]